MIVRGRDVAKAKEVDPLIASKVVQYTQKERNERGKVEIMNSKPCCPDTSCL